jgi:isopentenyl-diphosphate Delta-isomerase
VSGIHTSLEGAKAIAFGADMVGFGRSILKEATQSTNDVLEVMETRKLELRMEMFQYFDEEQMVLFL